MRPATSKDHSNGRAVEKQVSRRHLFTAAAPVLASASVALSGVSLPKAEAAAAPGDRLDGILKAGKIRIGTFLQYKPYTFRNPNGEPDGFDTDLAKLLAADMGVKPDFVDNTWDGIIPALQADKFDVIIADMTATTKRSLTVQFTDIYNLGVSGLIFRKEDHGRFSSLARFNDAKVTIGLLIQDANHRNVDRFFPKMKVRDFNSAEEAILAVQTKKVDCSAASLVFLNQYAQEHGGLSVMPINYPGSTNPVAMAVLPDANNTHLLSYLNLWVRYFYWTGQAEPLFKKWLPGMPMAKPERFTAPL